MPRYTATTSSNKYLKTPNTHQDKLTITKHELHNNNNNNTSQPYNLTTDLQQSKGFKLANPGTSDSVASNPHGPNNTDERLLTPYTTSEHPGNTKVRAPTQPENQGYSRVHTALLPTDHSTPANTPPAFHNKNPTDTTTVPKKPSPQSVSPLTQHTDSQSPHRHDARPEPHLLHLRADRQHLQS